MDVPDAIRIAIESRGHVTILAAGAVIIVSRVEDQPDVAGVGQLQEYINLIRSFHITGAMVMQHRPQACLVEDRLGNLIRAAGKDLPLRHVQPHLRRDAPGIFGAHGVGAVVVREHEVWRGRGGHGGQQARRLHRIGDAGGMGGGILHSHRHKCAQHDQVALRDFSTQDGGVGGHIAPIAQLRCGVAGLHQFIQHSVKRDCLALVLIFKRSPGTRRIANQYLLHDFSSFSFSLIHRK